jgi:hypothetical protein
MAYQQGAEVAALLERDGEFRSLEVLNHLFVVGTLATTEEQAEARVTIGLTVTTYNLKRENLIRNVHGI